MMRPNGVEKQIRPPVAPREPGANTVAYYPLTSTSTVNDMSGNSKTLTNVGATFGTNAGVDCAYLNGSSYLWRNESLFTGSSTFTVSLWLNNTSNPTAHGNIFSVGTSNGTNSFIIWRYDNGVRLGNLYLGGWTNDRDTGYLPSLNTWLNIIVTHSGGTAKVYVNNELKYTGSVSYGIQSGYTGVGCGINNGSPMIGNLSNVIIENKARTAQEISDYYNLSKGNYGL